MNKATPFFDFGFTKLGPVLTSYVNWAIKNAQAQGLNCLYGVMRDGWILQQVARVIAPSDMYINEIWLSRYACLIAALSETSLELLDNFLWRARPHPISVGTALRLLGLDDHLKNCPVRSDQLLTEKTAPAIISWIWQGEQGRALRRQVTEYRKGMLVYLKEIRFLEHGIGAGLLDLGYAGNTQHAFQKCLNDIGLNIKTFGYYFVATAGVKYAEASGCQIEGFLADRGEPHDFVMSYRPLIDWIEVSLACNEGSLLKFNSDGSLAKAPSMLPARQLEEAADIQRGILAFAYQYPDWQKRNHILSFSELRGSILGLTSDFSQPMFAHWEYDENFGTNVTRLLIR